MKGLTIWSVLLAFIVSLNFYIKDEPFPPDEEDIPCLSITRAFV
ncbi:hypothetical protein [Legionella birminghamensis]|uniref:Uncharacterized protein n=1 Tax=Legionella birminghamensis TaxID=28083 RepID=A0A378I8G8_9GAMM|nr:hypothetical protein [Legionella birminghamensis]STX31020.1 Uncharacterised protein [Legionella birminghamensis]